MADQKDLSKSLYPDLDVGRIRTPEDLDRMLAKASDELIRLSLMGNLLGLSSPETDQQLAQVAGNIARAHLNMEAAKKFHP